MNAPETAERGTAAEPLPLSVGQEALWFLHQLAPDSSAYNMALAFRIRAAVDVDAMRRAWLLTARRHDLLRSVFASSRDGVRRWVRPAEVMTVDVRDVPAGATPADLTALVQDAANEPFRLAEAPAARVVLFPCAPDDTVLLLAAHHVVLDAASQVVVVSDLLDAYAAVLAQRAPNWPVRDWTYTDHVAAEAALLAGPRGAELVEFWRAECAGASHVLDLPTDRPRPAVQRYVGSGHTIRVPVELVHRMRTAAREVRVTPFVFLVAAFETLLRRYSGQRDFLVGCAASTRGRDLRDVVGFFVNPVVLRATFGDTTTFRELAAATGERVRAALSHSEYPFTLLTKALGVARDPSRPPLFQVLVSAFTAGGAEPLLRLLMDGEVTGERMVYAGLPLATIDMPVQQAGQFDLTLELHMSRHYLTMVLKYATDLFDATTIERMGDHLVALIESAIGTPDERVTRLPMLTEADEPATDPDIAETDWPTPVWS
jgi:hypothetical protein